MKIKNLNRPTNNRIKYKSLKNTCDIKRPKSLLQKLSHNDFALSFVCIFALVCLILYASRHFYSSKNHKQFSQKCSMIDVIKQKLPHEDELLNKLLPKKNVKTELEALKLAESNTNIVGQFWLEWQNINSNRSDVKMKPNVTYCDGEWTSLTSPYRIKHNNLYWQVLQVMPQEENSLEIIKIYLYNAYYDNRNRSLPMVRLIGMNDNQEINSKKKWWCLLWFEGILNPVLMNVTSFFNPWPNYWFFGVKTGIYGAQIITCPIPEQHYGDIPKAVSLQPFGECHNMPPNPTNVLRVIHNLARPVKFQKTSIGICVQAMRFGSFDMSVRLVEWLEMVRILGADKVYFYVYDATPSMFKVLRHYQKEGLVDWRRLTLPDTQPNIDLLYQKYVDSIGGFFWPSELLELNDCLYRNLYRHDYLAVFDIDEMIFPLKVDNWQQMIQTIHKIPKSYYSIRHSYVYSMFEQTKITPNKPIPSYLYMMSHTFRGEIEQGAVRVKCFHRTSEVSAVHNHFPKGCIKGYEHANCHGIGVSINDSRLLHYRVDRSPEGNLTIQDQTAWKYFDQLEAAVRRKLWEIFKTD